MPYVDTNDGHRIWQSDRMPLMNNGDVYRRAAETLARDVERYLYSHTLSDGSPDPAYRNEDFLIWVLARFDTAKTGSGQSYMDLEWDPNGGVPRLGGMPDADEPEGGD